MPTFGPLGISKMFDEMHDIATQMVLKWARHGEDHRINITEDFTRLTLDSIALCAMGARLNSFYSNEVHPFVKSMVSFLVEAGNRGRRPPILNDIKRSSKKGFYSDIDCMRDFAEKLYTERLNEPNDKNDLLNAMINGRDKETGEGMSKESIINNMITFLVAGEHLVLEQVLQTDSAQVTKRPRASFHSSSISSYITRSPTKKPKLKLTQSLELVQSMSDI